MAPPAAVSTEPAPPSDTPARTTPEPKPETKPWRLGKELGGPSWVKLGLEHRSRIEYLESDFRSMADNDTRAFALLTLAAVEVGGPIRIGFELQDARSYASEDTPLNTTHVNPLDLLQAYVAVEKKGALAENDLFEGRAGRITIDLGTRRVVARNRFRNTINGFTGVDAKWTSPGKHVARAFAAMPVDRLPSDADALHDNELELDKENTDALLWSLSYGSPKLVLNTRLELYAVGFHERDGEIATRNRQLVTLGARWLREPKPGAVDFEVEVIPQVGTSRASTMEMDTTDLNHRALSWHAELGVSARMPWKPRFVLQHDYASGDRDPADRSMQRFDPLFGARRFDFGPTGIYGPVNRSNIQTPGLRVQLAPHPTLRAFASYRLFWLASPRDAWVPAGVRDTTGGTGRFVGQFVEAAVTWSPFAKNLSLEAGAAYLRPGQFAKEAPAEPTEPSPYVYTQLTATI